MGLINQLTIGAHCEHWGWGFLQLFYAAQGLLLTILLTGTGHLWFDLMVGVCMWAQYAFTNKKKYQTKTLKSLRIGNKEGYHILISKVIGPKNTWATFSLGHAWVWLEIGYKSGWFILKNTPRSVVSLHKELTDPHLNSFHELLDHREFGVLYHEDQHPSARWHLPDSFYNRFKSLIINHRSIIYRWMLICQIYRSTFFHGKTSWFPVQIFPYTNPMPHEPLLPGGFNSSEKDMSQLGWWNSEDMQT